MCKKYNDHNSPCENISSIPKLGEDKHNAEIDRISKKTRLVAGTESLAIRHAHETPKGGALVVDRQYLSWTGRMKPHDIGMSNHDRSTSQPEPEELEEGFATPD